ncbi:MAG: phosphomannomutase [Candidatus Parcubacteria bacterium]|jgi:HAD superfamily hydrolase (TIGR01484 family)|nr:phosphomannomutase [Candidatus Parcubacteria bacterium]
MTVDEAPAARSKNLIMFDLDGTLTKSKAPIEPPIADLIVRLLEHKKVAVISGGGYPQFQIQFLANLPGTVDNFSNLYLMPTSGTRLYVWKGNWIEQYAESLLPKEKERIMTALDSALRAIHYEKPEKQYGPLIEDRGSQITFSGLGQSAPAEEKYAWDPTRAKREEIAAFLKQKIPEFDVRIGGATSVDITRRGINKAYGIRRLEKFLKISPDDILFVGDALFYGGNDYPARATGVDCIQVSGPEETRKVIEALLA